VTRFKFRLWLKATVNSAFNNAIYLLRTAKRRELHKAIINKSGYSDMLWPLFAVGCRCGCDPLQVPPLEMTEVGLGWQNGGIKQSGN